MGRLYLLVLVLFASAAVAQEWTRPKHATMPKRYLASVPLGIDKAEVVAVMGLPAKQMELNGETLWQYELLYLQNQVATYTFVLQNDKLIDVRYSNGGRMNLSAKSADR